MTISVRAATREEYPLIRNLQARAFDGEDEALLWDYLTEHDSDLRPECVRVALGPDGKPVACTVLLPRRVRARHGWVDGAVVTLVACDPDYQGQGYGGATVRDGLRFMAEEGMALAILFGHITYYPRFGFAPVMGVLHTALTAESARRAWPEEAPSLLPATGADLPALTRLYEAHLAPCPCTVARPPEPWVWFPHSETPRSVLVLEDRKGYALVSSNPDKEELYVNEAAAGDGQAARRLLAALGREAEACGLRRVRMPLPPDHLLVRVALLEGAEQTYHPAKAGMAAVTRWEPLLPEGYAVSDQGLLYGGRLVLEAHRQALTQLALGYRPADDLLLLPGVRLTGGPSDRERLARDFPPTHPMWYVAPYWM